MTRFLQQSACKGQRPMNVAPRELRNRSELLSRLLRNRTVVRFVVAPGGFGKTCLAFEYAEVMFDFDHVFWVDGKSPCFIRDLDAGIIAQSIAGYDPDCRLAVFSDVPALDEARAEAFASAVHVLLKQGAEVLATTTPAHDTTASLFEERLVLDAHALLVSSEEALEEQAFDSVHPLYRLSLRDSIACFRWGVGGERRVVEGMAHEELPADVLVVAWSVLVLGRGLCEEVVRLVGGACDSEMIAFLSKSYPFLGIDAQKGVFHAVDIDLSLIRSAFRARLDELAFAAGRPSRDNLVAEVANCLIEQGECRRAARVVVTFSTRERISGWLCRQGWHLLWGDAVEEIELLFESVSRSKRGARREMHAMMSCTYARLGRKHQAIEFAKKIIDVPNESPLERATCALSAWTQGNEALRVRMEEEMALWLASVDTLSVPTVNKNEQDMLAVLVDVALAGRTCRCALDVWFQRVEDLKAGGRLSNGDVSCRELEQACLLAAAWVVDDLAARGLLESRAIDNTLVENEKFSYLLSFVCDRLGTAAFAQIPYGLGAFEAFSALARIRDILEKAKLPTPSDAAASAYQAALAQRVQSREHMRPKGKSFAATDSGFDIVSGSAVPELYVGLFDPVKVRLGERDITETLSKKRKALLVLALMVLYHGHELSRDFLVNVLWPTSDPKTATKSFYRLWRDLTHMLDVGGRCPYLVRSSNGCHVETSLVASDLFQRDELVRNLSFVSPFRPEVWGQTLAQLRDSFSGELLPAETENDVVLGFRRSFTNEMVDALLVVSDKLRKAKEPQGALQFARQALERDASREDSYAMVMRAQIACGQRTAALDTYFACRGYLTKYLGIDPSPEIAELYQALVEGREVKV